MKFKWVFYNGMNDFIEDNLLFKFLFWQILILFTLIVALPLWALWKLDIKINEWKRGRWFRKL